MAGKRRRARMERALVVGVTIRPRTATLRAEVMRMAETLPADLLARAVRRVRAFLAEKRGI